jgi:membrane-bound lytic murein transglycosylase D
MPSDALTRHARPTKARRAGSAIRKFVSRRSLNRPALVPYRIALIWGLLLAVAAPAVSRARDADFPEPEALRSAVAFWMRVYLEVTTSGGLLHDARHLGVVYETIRIDPGGSHRARERQVDARRRHWEAVLRRLGRGDEPVSERERALEQMLEVELGRVPTDRDWREAAQRVRFQLGQRDKFREGLIRAGAYEDEMRAIFRERGMPEDLAYLPHVESSFNVRAYSKYGAAGVWQFMRGTGRRFMTVNYVIDERLDPIRSTHAAARLLAENHRILGTWPLALTAYNHGAGGLARAKRNLGTNDIGEIVFRHQSRSFGFASRNFYAQFLAARRIVRSYESWFGPLERDVPEVIDEVELPYFAQVDDVERYLGVSREVVQDLNPALRPPVFRSGKRLPRGYVLRLPAGTVKGDAQTWLAQIPEAGRHRAQHANTYHVVRRGDTLSSIAGRYRTSIGRLVALNSLPGRHRIYPGQVLQLPEDGTPAAPPARGLVSTAIAAVPEPTPKPTPAPTAPEPAPTEPTTATEPAPTLVAAVSPPAELPVEIAPVEPAPAPMSEVLAAIPEPLLPPESVAVPVEPEPLLTAPAPASPDAASRFRRVDGTRITVDAGETLGHYAEWLEVSASRLRALNKLRPGRSLKLGQSLALDFSRVTPEAFLQRRIEYHKGIEEDFFGSFRVTGTVEHRLRRGESIWVLSHRVYAVPTWLIQRYNPDVDLARVTPGTKLVIPVTEKLG